jgi:hypothetical protein
VGTIDQNTDFLPHGGANAQIIIEVTASEIGTVHTDNGHAQTRTRIFGVAGVLTSSRLALRDRCALHHRERQSSGAEFEKGPARHRRPLRFYPEFFVQVIPFFIVRSPII